MPYDTVYQKDKKDCVFSKKIIEQLHSIVPEGVSDKEVDRVTYSKDYWPITLRWLLDGKLPALPDCIVWPENAQHVTEILRLANREKIPIVPFGEGSGVVGGAIPIRGGIVVGLSRKTMKEHVVKSALEGIVYRCKDVLIAMKIDSDLNISSLKVDGGTSRNNFLLQFMADMLNIKIERSKILEGTALGAAYLAGLASGYWESKDEMIKRRKVDRIFEPCMGEKKRRRLYEGWEEAIERSFGWGHHSL
jgi:glycerol kinase